MLRRLAAVALAALAALPATATASPLDVCVYIGSPLTDTRASATGGCGPGTATVKVGEDGVTACVREKCVHWFIYLEENLTDRLTEFDGSGDPDLLP